MLKALTAVTALGILAGCATTTTNPPAPAPSVEALKEDVRVLSSDEFEGRSPGTPGEEKTLAYLAKRFAEAGLQPGNQGSWFQDVPLVEITADTMAPLRVSGPAAEIAFAPRTDWVGVTYREQSRVALEDSELIVLSRQSLNTLRRADQDLFCILILNLARELARKLQFTDEIMLRHEHQEASKQGPA